MLMVIYMCYVTFTANVNVPTYRIWIVVFLFYICKQHTE